MQAADGRRVQVKAVPVKGKQVPAQIIDAGNTPKATLARNAELSLSEQIKRAKIRAKSLDLAHDAQEWAGLLHSLSITEITNTAQLAVVNGHMTAIEKGVVVVS